MGTVRSRNGGRVGRPFLSILSPPPAGPAVRPFCSQNPPLPPATSVHSERRSLADPGPSRDHCSSIPSLPPASPSRVFPWVSILAVCWPPCSFPAMTPSNRWGPRCRQVCLMPHPEARLWDRAGVLSAAQIWDFLNRHTWQHLKNCFSSSVF